MKIPKVEMTKTTLVLLFCVALTVSGCRISEFYCDNGECVGLDKYCDGRRDCQDGSDETKMCTRCNRTYYGDRRKTYHMDLTDELLPLRSTYHCPLTFDAGGGELGDLVELSFDHFHIGRLLLPPSSSGDNTARCVGGYMQILERDQRPDEAGRWCGSSMGISVYYSETSKVTVHIFLYPPVDDWPSGAASSPAVGTATSAAESVELSLKFRFLSKAEAVTRYGYPQALIYRGEWIPNSVCDRLFQDCDSQVCRIHSPNFPGITLRNVTCLYHITQRTIPRNHHAFIVVRQPNEDKISIQDAINMNVLTAANGIGDRTVSSSTAREIPTSGRILFRHERKLIFGDTCVHDYVTIYNGYDINNSPLLARFCGNGALSRVIGNGPDMVIAFHSAPSDQLEQHTFELNIDVVFVPINEVGRFIPDNRRCEWVLNGEEQRSGIVRSLSHLAAPNTTCSYHFKGREHHRVWLYFVKYRVETGTGSNGDQGPVGKQSPSIYGALYDGPAPNSQQNETILAKFDDENRVKLCFHAKSFDHFIPLRPCHYPKESYVSTGPEMFFQYTYSPLFGLNYLHMEARYEFVDTHQDGEELPGGSGICDRVFSSNLRPAGTFTSPRNVFLFGRGGKKSLSCTYKFVGRSTETIRLTFHKVRLGNRKCVTVQDFHSRRFICQPRVSSNDDASELNSVHHLRRNVAEEEVAEIKVSQVLWSSGVEIPVACVCELDQAITLDLVGNVGYVNLTVTGMTSLQDFDNFYFEASYEFYGDVCDNGAGYVLDSNVGGDVSIMATYDDLQVDPLTSRLRCPWLIMANPGQYIHLKIPGLSSSEICDTNNRIIIFSADESEPLSVICPANVQANNNNIYSRPVFDAINGHQTATGSQQSTVIEIYSGNSTKNNRKNGRKIFGNTLLVEFHVIEPGSFSFRWSRATRSTDRRLLGRKYRSEECANRCANPSRDSSTSDLCRSGSKSVVTSFLFWTCQRSIKCSEDDESGVDSNEEDVASTQWENCVTSAHFPWLYIGIGIGCGVLVTVVLVASLLHRRREVKAKKGKPVPTDEYPMDNTKEVDC